MRMIASLILLALACGSCNSGPGPHGRVREFLGDHAVAILSNPQRVEVYRVTGGLHLPAGAPTTTPAATISGFEIIAHAPDQDAAFGRELAAIFFSPDAYRFDFAKACIFQPDTLLRVHGPGGWVDFVLCFHCNEFKMAAYDADGKSVHTGSEDFDGVRDKLAALVKRATGVEPNHD